MATQHETIITCDWCGRKQALTDADRAAEVDLPEGWAWRDNEDLCSDCDERRTRALVDAKATVVRFVLPFERPATGGES